MICDIPEEGLMSKGDNGLNIVLEDWEGGNVSSGELLSPRK